MRQYNYNVTKGDTWNGVQITINKNGSPLDLTGAAIRIEYKLNSKTGIVKRVAEIGSGVSITDAVNGIFTIDGYDVDLDAGRYFYDIQIIISGETKTYVEGVQTVVQDVTNG